MSLHELPPVAAEAIAGLGALLLLLFVWRVTAGLRPLARVLGAALLALIAVGPIVLFLWLGKGSLDVTSRHQPAPAATERARNDTEPKPSAAEPPQPPPAPVIAPESSPTPREAEAPRPAPQPRIAVRQTEQDIVPVFYGTDRAPDPNAKRPGYTWQRGQKLQLGRALVRVPRAHQAANAANAERPWAIKALYNELTRSDSADNADAAYAATHFLMKEVRPLAKEELLALVRERLGTSAHYKDQAIVLVHGYNISFDSGVYRAAQFAYDLKFDGAVFLYSWPSGGDVASYTYDRDSTAQTEPYLREFLELVAKESGARSIAIIAHNMGAEPLLAALRDLKGAVPADVAIGEVILAAPDVDRATLEKMAGQLKGLARGVTLYATAGDRAVAVSRRFHGGAARSGDVPEAGPLVVSGIDTIDASTWSFDALGLNGSAYADSKPLLDDIARLIETGERPPDKRTPSLELVKPGKGEYWRAPRQGDR